jgi:hypothetical protein
VQEIVMNQRSRCRGIAKLKLVLLIIGLVVVVGGGIATKLVLDTTGSGGDSLLEKWVRGQILAIANDNLNPELHFTAFDLELPKTVTLSDIELVATDAALPDGRVTIFEAAKLTIVLAERPRSGKPLKIERVELTDPALRLVAAEPGSASFAGFSNLVTQQGESKPDGGSTQLSDIFELRLVKLNNAKIVYDPRLPDTEAMVLDGISTELKLEEPEEGWHQLSLVLDQTPILDLDVAGRMHLDDGTLDISSLALNVALSRENDDRLPPQLQSYLREHDVRGQLSIAGTATLSTTDPAGSTADLVVKLTDGFASAGEYVIPIQRLELPVKLADNQLLADLSVNAIGGQAGLALQMSTKDQMAGQAKLDITGMRIEQLLATKEGSGPPKYAGKIDGQVTLQGPFATITQNADGQGQINVTEGRLVDLPIVSGLINATSTVATLGQVSGNRGTADATFTFEGDRATFSVINLKSAAIAVRGKGDVYLDERLDLRFNGGPVERVQKMLGGAGDLIGKVTDSLMAYTVKGTMSEPKIGVQVAGVGKKGPSEPAKPAKPAEDNTTVVDEVGETIEQGIDGLNPFD